jgi:hypothetical protein
VHGSLSKTVGNSGMKKVDLEVLVYEIEGIKKMLEN